MKTHRSQAGAIRLTGAGKFLLVLVGLAVLGYAAWTYRDRLPFSCRAPASPAPTAQPTLGERSRPPAQSRRRRARRASGRPACCAWAWSRTPRPCTSSTTASRRTASTSGWPAVIAEALGAKRVQVVEADYEDLPDKLRAGEIDLIMAGYVPDPSIEGVDWSNGYLDFGLCHDRARGHGRALPHRRATSPASASRSTTIPPPSAGCRRTSPMRASASSPATTAGSKPWRRTQADALIYDYPFAAEEIKAHPRTVIVKYNLNQSKYAVGVPKGNYDLIYEVNAPRPLQGDTAVRRPDARIPVELLASLHEADRRQEDLHREAGDTLSRIAASASSATSTAGSEIWDLNRDRVANENLIYPRLVLLMP